MVEDAQEKENIGIYSHEPKYEEFDESFSVFRTWAVDWVSDWSPWANICQNHVH